MCDLYKITSQRFIYFSDLTVSSRIEKNLFNKLGAGALTWKICRDAAACAERRRRR
jgi:hypothetical protein